MAYIGTAPNIGDNRKLDDISSSFNGSTTTFDLKVATAYVYPGVATSLLISVGGVLQEPGSAYTLHANGKQITFTTAPTAGEDFYGIVLGASIDIGVPSDDSVTAVKIADGAVTAIKLGDALGFANVAGNVSIGRSLAVGYTDGRVPQANLDVKGNVYIGGDSLIADNSYIYFGDGKDLRVGHITNNSYLQDVGTGTLYIEGSSVSIRNVGGTEAMATFTPDGSVSLNYDNVKKFETTSTGVSVAGLGANVTGNVSVTRSLAVGYTDGRVPQANLDVKGNVFVSSSVDFPDGGRANFGGAKDLTIYHDGSDSHIKEEGTGDLYISAGDDLVLRTKQGAETALVANDDGAVQIYYDNDIKLETHTDGVTLLDKQLIRANLKDYGEVTSALGSAGGARTIDLEDGNSFSATVSASTVTWTFSNPTASDELCGFTLTLVNGGSQTVNWPGSVDWAGGTAPTLTTSGTDVLVFYTIDGGTIWHGMLASADSK